MEKLKWILYLSAFVIVVIPISIVLMTEELAFSSTFSNIVISAAIIFVILGKLITVYEERKKQRSIVAEIGVIIGISIVLVARFF